MANEDERGEPAASALRIAGEAVLWSANERDRAGRPLLVLMHGYGSHEGDLFGLSPYLPLGPAIASVRAPIAEAGGHAWFPRGGEPAVNPPGNPRAEIADAAVAAMLTWLDGVAPAGSGGAEPGGSGQVGSSAGGTGPAPRVGLLGFSQGGAMALQLMRHAPGRFACAVNLSGFVVEGAAEGDDELARRHPPVFWGRGTDDEVIPHDAIARTDAWLPKHADLDARIYEGLGHAVSPQELTDVAAFLRVHLG
ncbi:dienelactone hydrolase family protein [Microbacterium sp. STN6]|uniref:alpha/beta hydrolase n=1 Tax=Microbacterium sp. STN6 TaxID=2995588 RepID=UPI002260CCB1|nr:dienelactone hydrolase family protein [Microbacterium sp. STN6]MCX7523129.1 dienelactone hydrolase family protein [Microbacterium sp. STN6]